MRALAFFLILANLLFWAWVQGYLGMTANPDALRAKQQLLADRVRVVSRDEPPGDRSPTEVEKAAEKQEAPPVSEPGKVVELSPENVPEKPQESKPAEACIQLGDVSVDDADRLEKTLTEKLADFRARRTATRDAGASYWVYIPPLATKKEVDTKVAELKKLQVKEYFVIQENGPNNHAISLGLFSTREAADSYLETLRGQKVRSARVTEKSARPASATLEIQGPESRLDALRQAIAEVLPESRPVACGALAPSLKP